ncbi:MAG: phytoene/squalene synthase family protein [Planctomycetota bacterium]|nr:phytoene/squalene synthase family protein [Planctomycetota bacterium]
MSDARINAALEACAEITRTQARNFYHGLRLLPSPKREALYAVYAWMRIADDIADEEGASADARRARLDELAAGTRHALAGEARDDAPVLVALAAISRRYALPAADFEGALEGQRMDLEPRVYATFAETELYCDRVASTVGRICLDIWGVRDGADAARARELSTKRGIAFQLTNILRDVREDLARGRCYLPADELAAHGLDAASLVAWRQPEAAARFIGVQCDRARRCFAESAALDAMVSPDARPTIVAMSEIYRGILGVIARDPAKAMRERARLSTLTKSWIALRARFGVLSSGAAR